MIYFDNASTSFPKAPCIEENFHSALNNYSFNASRGELKELQGELNKEYEEAKAVADIIYRAREGIASFVHSKPEAVVFSSSATEALNNIIYGLGIGESSTCFVSPFEHNSVLRPLYNLSAEIKVLPFDKETFKADLESIKLMFSVYKVEAIFLSQISNVTGFELPYTEIFKLAKAKGIPCILDASQGFGIYDIDPKYVDFIVFNGHKSLYCIPGVSGYINLTDYKLNVFKAGGTGSDSLNLSMPLSSPERFEAGTSNSFAIYLLLQCIGFIKNNKIAERIKQNMAYLIDELKKINALKLYLPKDYIPRSIVSINREGFKANELASILYDEGKIATRSGYHCAAFCHDFLGTKSFSGTVRISLGFFNTREEIDILITTLREFPKTPSAKFN